MEWFLGQRVLGGVSYCSSVSFVYKQYMLIRIITAVFVRITILYKVQNITWHASFTSIKIDDNIVMATCMLWLPVYNTFTFQWIQNHSFTFATALLLLKNWALAIHINCHGNHVQLLFWLCMWSKLLQQEIWMLIWRWQLVASPKQCLL